MASASERGTQDGAHGRGRAGTSRPDTSLSDTGVFLAGLVLPPGMSEERPSKAREVVFKGVGRSEMENLAIELGKPAHLGWSKSGRVQLLNSSPDLASDELISKLGTDHVNAKLFPAELVARMINGGLLPLLETKADQGPDPSEYLIGVRAHSRETGDLKAALSISLPICDGFQPWAKQQGIEKKIRFVLLAGPDFELLTRLRSDEEARRKFLRELDPAKSARTTFMEVLEKAIALGGSDIHIEPQGAKDARIRYRVDGALLEDPTALSTSYAQEFVNVIKVTAQLDITEKRRPQDGSISFKNEETARSFLADGERKSLSSSALQARFAFLEGKSLRISTLPTPNGESCAIRILQSADSANLRLVDLGFPRETLSALRTLLGAPNGVLLVAGPTGSGKSTTLAGCLMELNRPDVKIITVEDPVEQEQRGVTQTQVRSDLDYTFADALRSILRHDPDIVLVGEVRDAETAQIMIQGANTGHLMLSTIHTNDSISVLKRLRDLGVEEFQIQDSLLGVLSQRLARKLCGSCKERYDARPELNRLFGEDMFAISSAPEQERLKDPEAIIMSRPGPHDKVKACKGCKGKGYKGRIAVPELWVIGQDEKDLISRGEHGHRAFYDAAIRNGMVPMSIQGFRYALDGHTDLSELSNHVLRPDELILRKEAFRQFLSEHSVGSLLKKHGGA